MLGDDGVGVSNDVPKWQQKDIILSCFMQNKKKDTFELVWIH